MIEPTTITVPNLAVRWNQTPSDILEHAANMRLHLLFNFDGLAFDSNDDWLPSGKDWQQRRELEALTDFVKSADAQLKRRAAGQLSQWESLDSDEAVSLRAKVTARNQAIEIMNEVFDDRDCMRQKKHYRGYLMAGPATVDELKRVGFAVHPLRAYKPEGPFTLHTVDDVLVLDGPIVRLEPGAAQWKERQEPADMVVSMADVKAIEATATRRQTAPATDTATPAPVAVVSSVAPPKQRAQESRILELLTAQGYVPMRLSQRTPGKPGPKAEIRTLALTEPALFSAKSFERAWERLRNEGAVAGAE